MHQSTTTETFSSACKGIFRENRQFCYSLEVLLWESDKALKARSWAKVIIFPFQSLAPKFCLRPSCIFWQDHPGVSVLEVAVFLPGFSETQRRFINSQSAFSKRSRWIVWTNKLWSLADLYGSHIHDHLLQEKTVIQTK